LPNLLLLMLLQSHVLYVYQIMLLKDPQISVTKVHRIGVYIYIIISYSLDKRGRIMYVIRS